MADIHVYCDESCHLEHDSQKVMVLGAVTCPRSATSKVTNALRDLRVKHGLPPGFEIKWTKVSGHKVDFYRDVIDLFFNSPALGFRALVVPDKAKLDHPAHQQTHDDFYFKMYFQLLSVLLDPKRTHAIYLDVKDTRSADKTHRLHKVLCNTLHDFDRSIIEQIELVRSHQVGLIQVADLLIGAVSYVNRELHTSDAKVALVEHVRRRSRYRLTQSTLLREKKFNLLHWVSRSELNGGEGAPPHA